jgi:hypothetical protein
MTSGKMSFEIFSAMRESLNKRVAASFRACPA